MDAPLVGTPRQNYSFFYTASISAILSVIVLFVITEMSDREASIEGLRDSPSEQLVFRPSLIALPRVRKQ